MSTGIRRRPRLSAPRFLKFRNRPRPECLEERSLLTGGAVGTVVTPAVGSTMGPYGLFGGPPGLAYSPALISTAYGFNKIQFGDGSTKADGTGQTIAIVDAFDLPTIASDLAAFDSAYHLAAPPSFQKIDQTGGTNLPAANANWGVEIALDVEWAHAMAPGANIVLVEANSASTLDLMQAVKTAAGKASVVSMSWGGQEFLGESFYDTLFATPGVTFVSASGDNGGITGASFPSASPNVVSVGGTTLSTTVTGAYKSETAWSGLVFQGSGGGVSALEPLPSYQGTALGLHYATGRVTPDISYNASISPTFTGVYTGYGVFDSYHEGGWNIVGGTSAGAPQISAMIAIADQGRVLNHLPTLSSHDTLAGVLYALAPTLNQNTPSAYFHDVTVGFTAQGVAGHGFDRATGLGSPIANTLVNFAVDLGALSTPGVSASSASHTPAMHPGTFVFGPEFIVFVPFFFFEFAAAPPYAPIIAPFTVAGINSGENGAAVSGALNSSSTSLGLPAQPTSAPSSGGIYQPRDERDTPLFSLPFETDLVPFFGDPWFFPKDVPAPANPDAPAPKQAPEKAPAPAPAPAPEKDAEKDAFELWDAALHSYVMDVHGGFAPLIALDSVPALPLVESPLRPSREYDVETGSQAVWAMGTAVALWSLWEYRSRSPESRRRPFDSPV